MGKEAYKIKQLCTECLCCIRHYNGLCPGLIIFSRSGCQTASETWRKERDEHGKSDF